MRRIMSAVPRSGTGSAFSASSATPSTMEIRLTDTAGAWRSAGFNVTTDGLVRFGNVQLQLGSDAVSVGFTNLGGIRHIDGMAVHETAPIRHVADVHPNHVTALDTINLQTVDVQRTKDAFRTIGVPLLRETTAVRKGLTMLFYRPGGGPIFEIVGPTAGGKAEKPMKLWGLMLCSDRLDDFCAHLPKSTKPPWKAVQPGRRITTLKGREHGIKIAIAVLDPHPGGKDGKVSDVSEETLAARAREQEAELRRRSKM